MITHIELDETIEELLNQELVGYVFEDTYLSSIESGVPIIIPSLMPSATSKTSKKEIATSKGISVIDSKARSLVSVKNTIYRQNYLLIKKDSQSSLLEICSKDKKGYYIPKGTVVTVKFNQGKLSKATFSTNVTH